MGIKNFLNCLQCCCHCGVPLLSLPPLCGYCWGKLDKYLFLNSYRIKFLPINYLFPYEAKSSRVTKDFALALKGGGFSKAVERVIAKTEFVIRPPKIDFLVPAPLSNNNIEGEDHARVLCSSLAKLLSIPMLDICQRVGVTGVQKEKNKKERQRINIKLKDWPVKKEAHYCFVDDVITTGSTMHSVYKALGKPKNFSAFCLFYQALL